MVALKTSEAARLMEVSDRTVRNWISNGKVQATETESGYKIALHTLPQKAQSAYLKTHQLQLPTGATAQLDPMVRARAQAQTVSVGVQAIVSQNEKQKRNIKLYHKAKQKPAGITTKEWYSTLSGMYKVSMATIYRVVKQGDTEGFAKAKKESKTAWSDEAIAYMVWVFTKAFKQSGACTKQNAYNRVKTEAEKQGWTIGSRTSAYNILKDPKHLNPLVADYVRGGNLQLDNTFWILRNYDNLKPFQMIVGDQHIFDFWVKDHKGELFRPECYLWLDMKTRMPYGIAFDKTYNSNTVKNALYMGLEKFGKFSCTYNDNGKPEISEFITQIIDDVQKLGMEMADTSDMYRTEKGTYVVTDENDNEVDVVLNKQAWEKAWVNKNRHFAKVKNAKAKPIEPFFKTLEQLLTDMILPGAVIKPGCSAAEEEEHKRRMKQNMDILLTFEEFQLQVVNGLITYMNRHHTTLGCSPVQKLMECVNKGWQPIYIDPYELDLIFLRRKRRKVQQGRVQINKVLYQGENLTCGAPSGSQGLWHLDGKTVEVRYSEFDPDKALAVLADGEVRPLYIVPEYQMLNAEHMQEAIRWKRESMKAVREQWKSITSRFEGKVLQTSRAPQIQEVKQVQKSTNLELSKKLYQQAVAKAKKIQEQCAKPEPTHWQTTHERYEFYINKELQNKELTDKEKAFMQSYEESMDESEKAYWKSYKTLGGQDVN